MAEETRRAPDAAWLMLGYAAVTGLADNALPALARNMGLWQFLAIRAALALLLLGAFVALRPSTRLWPRNARAVLLRALVHAAAIACFYAAMVALSPPQALAALFTAPLFAIGFDALHYRRAPRRTALGAVGCGFAGVLLALPASTAASGPGMALGLLAGALYAASTLMARRLCIDEHPLTLTGTYLGASGFVAAAAMLWLGLAGSGGGFLTRPPVWPGALDWALLAGQAAATLIGVTLMLGAWQRMDAARAGALHYLCLPVSGFCAWLLWGWLPRPAEIAGMGLIALAGLIVLADGSRTFRRPAAPRRSGHRSSRRVPPSRAAGPAG